MDVAELYQQEHWNLQRRPSPILATSVHSGHWMTEDLLPYLAADSEARRLEEDPMTDYFASAVPNHLLARKSRFLVDLNRSRDMAMSIKPENTWGKRIWSAQPPEQLVNASLKIHDEFYALMHDWISSMIKSHGAVVVLDIHSYNHRRDGSDAPPAPVKDNPEIDLGVTELNHDRYRHVVDALEQALASTDCQGNKPDVRRNIRYPDGGNWPEWVYRSFGDSVCTVTLEYKKFYMNEWTGAAFLPIMDDLRTGVRNAAIAAEKALATCR